MTAKTVLFGMPVVSGLYKLIHENLKYHGFNVIDIVENGESFRYPSFGSWLKVKWRKIVYNDTYAKKQLKWQVLQNNINEKIKQAGGLDYVLLISSDIYSQEFIRFLKRQSKHGVVNYQFDGLHRFPAIYPLIKEFDRFYVFDPDDLKNPDYPLLPATNFYFDNNLENVPERTLDFYFTGVHMDSRAAVIARFGRYVKERKKTADINILWKRNGDGRKTYPDDSITIIDKIIDFEENINRARQARVLIDFVIDEHKGLSFRTFEALGYQQKLITTNPQVKYYDFYHPNNFLIWDGYDFAALDDFLEKPYVQVDESIRKKYSFGNWINYILKINPYQEINLPN
jgi:hypothetical protein